MTAISTTWPETRTLNFVPFRINIPPGLRGQGFYAIWYEIRATWNRAYDPQAALLRARDTFWRTGYAGTSLDELAAATGMNRPSLYAAFGDKRALYLEALEQYWKLALAEMREALAADLALDEALMRVYDGALSIYFSGDGRPRGCFVIGTAVTEAVEDSEIRNSLAAGFHMFDTDFEIRLRTAREKGELKEDADPEALAVLATATMHTIAIRARTGAPRAELRELARKAVKVICG
jgi:AcrR family transcriptional regulator